VDAVLTLDTDPSHASTLSLSGTNTHQLAPVLKDIAGSAQSASQSFKYVSRNPAVATVSVSGLVTGVSRGTCVIEVAYPAFNGSFLSGSDGLPSQKIYNEIIVSVRA
jgi:hypothetical protein